MSSASMWTDLAVAAAGAVALFLGHQILTGRSSRIRERAGKLWIQPSSFGARVLWASASAAASAAFAGLSAEGLLDGSSFMLAMGGLLLLLTLVIAFVIWLAAFKAETLVDRGLLPGSGVVRKGKTEVPLSAFRAVRVTSRRVSDPRGNAWLKFDVELESLSEEAAERAAGPHPWCLTTFATAEEATRFAAAIAAFTGLPAAPLFERKT